MQSNGVGHDGFSGAGDPMTCTATVQRTGVRSGPAIDIPEIGQTASIAPQGSQEDASNKKRSERMSHWQKLPRHEAGTNRRKPIMTGDDLFAAAPSLMKAWFGTSAAVNASLDPTLTELVKIRASQINGCANCINMHTAEARSKGETEQRLYLLNAWREAPVYTDRERAALAWTEALTRLSEGHDLEDAYEALKAHFTVEEQVKLTLVINVINGWNRLSVGFGVWLDPAAAKAAVRAVA
jgi:AhpD family alkylhydroperoxidase